MISNGFGSTYDARQAIKRAGGRWDKRSKSYIVTGASAQMRRGIGKTSSEIEATAGKLSEREYERIRAEVERHVCRVQALCYSRMK